MLIRRKIYSFTAINVAKNWNTVTGEYKMFFLQTYVLFLEVLGD